MSRKALTVFSADIYRDTQMTLEKEIYFQSN